MLKYGMFHKVASVLYNMIFRALLKTAIDNPDEEWDDDVLKMCDAFFGYEG